MASSMTTLTHVATVKAVRTTTPAGADGIFYTLCSLSIAADTSNETGFGAPRGGSDPMAGVALVDLWIPSGESVTLPAVGDTFNVVLN